jgi:hypothetical protein
MIWISVLIFLLGFPPVTPAFPISSAAWSHSVWQDHCKDVRTSYNPTHSLATDRLTLTPDDPRFSDFLYWVWANKILEHQVEQIGGQNGRDRPTGSFFIGRLVPGGKPTPSPPLIRPSITSRMNITGGTRCSRSFSRSLDQSRESTSSSGFQWTKRQPGHSFLNTSVGQRVRTIDMSSTKKVRLI